MKIMSGYKIIFSEKGEIEAKYHHPDSMDFVEYKYTITVKDGGKTPVAIKFKGVDTKPSFAPEMPEVHIIRDVNIIALYVKIEKWFARFGYKLF